MIPVTFSDFTKSERRVNTKNNACAIMLACDVVVEHILQFVPCLEKISVCARLSRTWHVAVFNGAAGWTSVDAAYTRRFRERTRAVLELSNRACTKFRAYKIVHLRLMQRARVVAYPRDRWFPIIGEDDVRCLRIEEKEKDDWPTPLVDVRRPHSESVYQQQRPASASAALHTVCVFAAPVSLESLSMNFPKLETLWARGDLSNLLMVQQPQLHGFQLLNPFMMPQHAIVQRVAVFNHLRELTLDVLNKGNGFLRTSALRRIAQATPVLEVLALRNNVYRADVGDVNTVEGIFADWPLLRKVTLCWGYALRDAVLRGLAAHCPLLAELSVELSTHDYIAVLCDAISTLTASCRALTRLALHNWPPEVRSVVFRAVADGVGARLLGLEWREASTLDDTLDAPVTPLAEDVRALLCACPKLMDLQLTSHRFCDWRAEVDDDLAFAIGECGDALRTLVLGLTRLSPAGLQHILHGCHELLRYGLRCDRAYCPEQWAHPREGHAADDSDEEDGDEEDGDELRGWLLSSRSKFMGKRFTSSDAIFPGAHLCANDLLEVETTDEKKADDSDEDADDGSCKELLARLQPRPEEWMCVRRMQQPHDFMVASDCCEKFPHTMGTLYNPFTREWIETVGDSCHRHSAVMRMTTLPACVRRELCDLSQPVTSSAVVVAAARGLHLLSKQEATLCALEAEADVFSERRAAIERRVLDGLASPIRRCVECDTICARRDECYVCQACGTEVARWAEWDACARRADDAAKFPHRFECSESESDSDSNTDSGYSSGETWLKY
jgi:hypothetical protein